MSDEEKSILRRIPGFRSGTPWKMILAIIGYGLIALIIISALLPDSAPSSTVSTPSPTQTISTPAPTQTISTLTTTQTISTPAPIKTVSTPAPALKSDTTTMGERNAAKKALSYLKYSSFSREGLINQLEYEGFTHQEAIYGVDQSGANWNDQAALKAESYLKYSSFSREGLINQLEYEGFTPQQAEYGVRAVGY